MITGINHIGIAVKSIDEALAFYRDQLGLAVESIEEVPSEGVRVAFLPVGHSRLELIEPLDAQSPLHKALEKRGEGLHHLAFSVQNIDKSAQGIKTLSAPRKGAKGTRVTFVHPRDAHGILIEFCDTPLDKP